MPLTRHIGLDLVDRRRRLCGTHGQRRVDHVRSARDHLDGDRLHDVVLLRRDEAVLQVMRRLELRDDALAVGEIDDQGRIRPLVAQMHLAQRIGALRVAALAGHLGAALFLHPVERLPQLFEERIVEDRLHRAFAHHAEIGKPHAIGREHPGEGVDKDTADPEGIRDQAGVLAARAAEAVEGIPGDVMAALDRDLLDRLGHVLDRDHQEAVRDFHRRAPVAGLALDFGGERGELLPHDVFVERLVGVGAEHPGEKARADLADHHVGVGHAERAAPAVARRPRIGAGRIRSHAVARAVEMEDRAAAGSDGMDLHHRRAHPHARDQSFEGALVLAIVMRDVGRRSAHVEADDLVVARHRGGPHRADDAAGRARQDAVLAAEEAGVGESAVRLHEHQPGFAELVPYAVDIAFQDRRDIGVDDGGVAATDQLHQGAHLVRDRDLPEADLAREPGDLDLVVVVAVAVDEHDRDRLDTVPLGPFQRLPGAFEVDRDQLLAVGRIALVDLDHALVQELGQDDMAGEEEGSVLVADTERVAEPLGNQEDRAVALALQQRVRRDRGAHLDGVDRLRRDPGRRLYAEQVANTLERRVLVTLRVFRQQLVGNQLAVGFLRDEVGKGSAAVDPELPAAIAHRSIAHVSTSFP